MASAPTKPQRRALACRDYGASTAITTRGPMAELPKGRVLELIEVESIAKTSAPIMVQSLLHEGWGEPGEVIADLLATARVGASGAGPYTLGYTDGQTQGREDAIRTLARVFRKLLSDNERALLTRWLTGADHLDEFLAVLRDIETEHSENTARSE